MYSSWYINYKQICSEKKNNFVSYYFNLTLLLKIPGFFYINHFSFFDIKYKK